MFRITSITDEPKQTYKLPIEDSDLDADMTLTWRDTQNSWFMDVSFDTFSVKQIRVTFSPNLLIQFANRIPFGLMCVSENKQDPLDIQAFLDGTCSLNILSRAEVTELEALSG